jgi:2,4-dienoyl-CoA reductase-like NADH-dependent reductase (Old Yellow Enzyme family)
MLAWRKAGAWDRAVLGVGGITTIERAVHLLHEGADAVLVGTAALVDPPFATRLREAVKPRRVEAEAVQTNGTTPDVQAAPRSRRAKPASSSKSRRSKHAVR